MDAAPTMPALKERRPRRSMQRIVPRRWRALDLFCGAGGVSMGLHRAGFEVTGVDIRPQPRYPFNFIQGDALAADPSGYDFVWASPPCQRYSLASVRHRNEGKQYPDLVAPVRAKLKEWGGPWIIENVINAPLSGNVVMLCGTMFGLGVFRHRLFESNFLLLVPAHTGHNGMIGDGKYFSVAGGAGRWKSWGTVHRNVSKGTAAQWRQAMGIAWMTRNEIKEAIPPAYSEFLARQILTAIKAGNAALCHPAEDAGGAHGKQPN